jgi:hypothetical protein
MSSLPDIEFTIAIEQPNKEDHRWVFTCEHDYVNFKGVFDVESLPETSKARQFLQICPQDLLTNFDAKSYKSSFIPGQICGYIVVELLIAYINEKIEIVLKPDLPIQSNNSEGSSQEAPPGGVLDSNVLHILLKQQQSMIRHIKTLESKIKVLESPGQTGYSYYPDVKSFNIDPKQLLAYAKEFSTKYREFRAEQVNMSEDNILIKYGSTQEDPSYTELSTEYCASVRSYLRPFGGYNNFIRHTFIMTKGCWTYHLLENPPVSVYNSAKRRAVIERSVKRRSELIKSND